MCVAIFDHVYNLVTIGELYYLGKRHPFLCPVMLDFKACAAQIRQDMS